ncbi:hypothetical protein ACQKOD_06020 [Bacillus mycoides]
MINDAILDAAQMKPKSACNECAVIMDDKRTQEAIDDRRYLY